MPLALRTHDLTAKCMYQVCVGAMAFVWLSPSQVRGYLVKSALEAIWSMTGCIHGKVYRGDRSTYGTCT